MASSGLAVALLIIYVTLSLPTIYVAIKHGLKHGAIIGWFFLFTFCTLRIVASALELNDATSTGAALVSSIGLSPLLAATCGILHESRAYVLPKTRRPFDTPYFIVFHILVTTAIALVASGASKLSDTTLSPDQMKHSRALVKGGMVLFLLGWISLATVTLATFQHRSTGGSGKRTEIGEGRKLLFTVAFSIPFLGIRVLESLIYFFSQDPLLNPVSGSLGLRIGLQVIEELVVTLLFIVTGILTRNISATGPVDTY